LWLRHPDVFAVESSVVVAVNARETSGPPVLGDEVLAAGRTAESVLEGHEGFGLVSFVAGLARQLNQGIRRKPLDDEPAHAEVFGKKTGGPAGIGEAL